MDPEVVLLDPEEGLWDLSYLVKDPWGPLDPVEDP